MFLEKKKFQTVIASTPLISIDLIVRNRVGEYLLGLRTNKPAQGLWFVLGGRILKNESMDDAFSRLVLNELGINFHLEGATFKGVFEHFYNDNVFGEEGDTHYIVLSYEFILDVALDALPKAQHSQYKWFSEKELLNSQDVHLHTKWYVNS